MNKVINLDFAIDKVQEFKEVADSRFSLVKIFAFSDGENAHTEDVDLANLKFSSETIYDIPIKVQFTDVTPDGIGTHSDDYFNVGFIPRQDNPIVFQKDEVTNKTFLTVDGLIWNGDSHNIIDIMKKSDGNKKVSVEMAVSDFDENQTNGKIDIKKFVFTSVCIISDYITEACKGSNIQLQFAEDKEQYIKMNFAEDINKATEENNMDNKDETNNNEQAKDEVNNEIDYKEKYESLSLSFANLEKERDNALEELADVKGKNVDFANKIESMKDYEEIKSNRDELQKTLNEIKQNEVITKTFADIKNRGFNLNDETMNNFKNKISDFADINVWANHVKASMLDSLEERDVQQFDMPNFHKENKPKSIWGNNK